jgi:hypothetical protein
VQRYFREHVVGDYFDGRFDGPGEALMCLPARLSLASAGELAEKIHQLAGGTGAAASQRPPPAAGRARRFYLAGRVPLVGVFGVYGAAPLTRKGGQCVRFIGSPAPGRLTGLPVARVGGGICTGLPIAAGRRSDLRCSGCRAAVFGAMFGGGGRLAGRRRPALRRTTWFCGGCCWTAPGDIGGSGTARPAARWLRHLRRHPAAARAPIARPLGVGRQVEPLHDAAIGQHHVARMHLGQGDARHQFLAHLQRLRRRPSATMMATLSRPAATMPVSW